MHTLEPLCNLEQSLLLKELKFNEETEYTYAFNEDAVWITSRVDAFDLEYTKDVVHHYLNLFAPTISMARNWLFEKFGVLLQTRKYGDEPHYFDCLCDDKMNVHACSSNLYIAESSCLTEILKHLKAKSND